MTSMLNDVEFLATRLGKLDGFRDTAEYLEKIIKAKDVRNEEPPPPPPPLAADKPSSETKRKSVV